jgi:tRNA(Ile)-lysidine synthase
LPRRWRTPKGPLSRFAPAPPVGERLDFSAVKVFLNTDALDRRLDPTLTTPVAVAFSGGGDSLAALLLTKAWADRCGRRVLALTVDHRLQPDSASWVRFAAETALRIGADFRALSWDIAKPAHGLPAAARAARHRLIAEAARQAGARVVVFGHTADDILEGELMRAEGARLGALREWSPSPVWPEGRDVFLLRPLLDLRRAVIREALSEAGERWIDDPANEDPRSARARARLRLRGSGGVVFPRGENHDLAALARSATIGPPGFLRMDRRGLRAAPAPAARRVLAAGVLCAGGGERPPRGDRLERLLERVLGPAPFQATLAGAKIVADDALLIVRDAGEARRGGLAPIRLAAGVPDVWDGRFELTAHSDSFVVRALAGAAAGLDQAQRDGLRAVPAPARPALPLVTGGEAPSFCPILVAKATVGARSLIAARFLAACGAISKEPAT